MKIQRPIRYLHAVIFALLVCSPALSQRERDTYSTASPSSFEVAGRVRLAETGLPAQKVQVKLERFGGGLVDQIDSDSGGRFRFPNLPRGYYRVIVSASGYRQAQQDADLQVLFRAFLVFDLVSENDAKPAVEVIDARAPAAARDELIRGRTALARKSYAEARDHLQKAVSLYPNFYEAHFLLGMGFVDSREWSKAENAFQRALQVRTDSSPATIMLGEVYWRQKRYDEAERTLLEGLKLDDKSWHGYFTLARLYWDLEKTTQAAGAIGRTLQLKPDFAEAHLLAGNILLRLNEKQRALAEYETYLQLSPKGEFADQARELVKSINKAIAGDKKPGLN
jgi:tetratricopeptide (TPR) repeat protein